MPQSKILCVFLTTIIIIGAFKGYALAWVGSCQQFEFPVNPEGKIDWPYTVKVIEQDTPIEETPVSNMSSLVLDFNTSLRVLDVQGSRVQVRELDAYQPLGWIERSALLCAICPLKGNSGLEQKFYIKISHEIQGDETKAVKAYPTSDLQDCAGQCRRLSKFAGYFVFDEKENSYLLGETFTLNDTSTLVGWVSKEYGFIWNTAYALRPEEETTICAYATIEEAVKASSQHCLPISGGKQWFRSDLRLPVLEYIEQSRQFFYRVTLTLPENDADQGKIAYIPVSEDVVEDVWQKSDDLDKWISLLREFEAFKNIYAVDGENLRENFVFALTDALEKIFRKSLRENTGIPLKHYLQRECGLPVRDDSPIFRYSIEDLMNPQIVPDCEIARLITWAKHAKQLLSIVYHGDQRPVYTQEPFPGECPSGENIPFIVGDIQSEPLGDDPAMRYDHNFQKAHIYWVPKEYMP